MRLDKPILAFWLTCVFLLGVGAGYTYVYQEHIPVRKALADEISSLKRQTTSLEGRCEEWKGSYDQQQQQLKECQEHFVTLYRTREQEQALVRAAKANPNDRCSYCGGTGKDATRTLETGFAVDCHYCNGTGLKGGIERDQDKLIELTKSLNGKK